MFDSHAHVAFYQFDEDREEVMARARKANVSWLEVGTDIEQSRAAVALAAQHDFVWATVGVHPSDVKGLMEEEWQEVTQLLKRPRVVAIGEVGLDYYRGGTKEEQLPVLERFVSLALERSLPVIFHVRNGEAADAHDDLIAFLQSLPECPAGVIHTYSGTVEQARRYLALGLCLSFSGVVTFKNAGELLEVAQMVPADRMLIETDCPFLAPEPYRGKRNEPAYVHHVAQKLAERRGLSVETVERLTEENARQLFRL